MERSEGNSRLLVHHLGVGVPYDPCGFCLGHTAKLIRSFPGVGVFRREFMHYPDGADIHHLIQEEEKAGARKGVGYAPRTFLELD